MRVSPHIKTFFYGVTILTFLYVSVFALPMMATTHHHDGMPMSNCPFMVGEVALCEMNVTEHIASWQAMFVVLPPVESILFVLLALVLAFVVSRFLYDPPDPSLPRQFVHKVEPPPLSFTQLLLGTSISPRAP